MSAARLTLVWDEPVESANFAFTIRSVAESRLVRQITPANRPAHCPECHSIIYSRRHRLCGVCGLPLPVELLFSPSESARVERLLRGEQTRHRKWMELRKDVENK